MRNWGLILLALFVVVLPAVTWAAGAQQMSGQEKPMMDKQMMRTPCCWCIWAWSRR